MKSAILYLPACVPLIAAFAPPSPRNSLNLLPSQYHAPAVSSSPLHQGKIIDAEFVIDDDDNDDSTNDPSSYSTAIKNKSNSNSNEMSLVEYSQNQDRDWKSMPVAFCDTQSNTYIDCNLAFYTKDPINSEVEYALGVPCEIPIVVALEYDEDDDDGDKDKDLVVVNNKGWSDQDSLTHLSKVIPINPDEHYSGDSNDVLKLTEQEKEEIFQTAAHALMEEFGPNIRLKKTPRVLTLEGDLEGILGDWKDVLLGVVGGGGMNNMKKKRVGKKKMTDTMLDLEEAMSIIDDDEDDEHGEDYFDTIMKRDFGPDYMKLLEDDDDDIEVDKELLKIFEMENDQDEDDGDITDLSEMLKFLEEYDEEENDKNGDEVISAINDNDDLLQQLKPSAALKILSFIGPNDREYSILRPLRPILLVGKEDPEDYTRRMLLTDDEMKRVLPRLERSCREGLEKAGFFLAGGGDNN